MKKIIDKDRLIKELKQPKGAKLSKEKRAEILLLVAEGKSEVATAKIVGVNKRSVELIKKDNRDILDQISNDIIENNIDKTEQVLNKFINLLDKKADILAEGENLNYTKATELSGAMKDLFNKRQIEQGKPTQITDDIRKLNVTELKLEAIRIAKRIENGSTTELIEAVFQQ